MLRPRTLLGVLSALYVVVIGAITLTPDPFDPKVEGMIDRMIDGLSQHPISAWISYDVVEFTANIGMFVPLGLLLALLIGRRGWWWAIIIGVGYTVIIECTQALVLSATRFATLSDVIANTLGAVIGAVLARFVLSVAQSRVRRERVTVRVP